MKLILFTKPDSELHKIKGIMVYTLILQINLLNMSSIHSEEYKELIELLRMGRLKKRMYQREVAEQLDVPQSYISKIELCELKVDVLDYFKIAKIVDVPVDEIVKKIYQILK